MIVDAQTDQILSDLTVLAERVHEAESDLAALRADLDQQIARARATGTTVADLMDLTGLTRATIYRSLERAGLR